MGLPAESSSRAGQVLKAKYRLEERIGAGGMGDVYRARNTMIERTVAIKLLHPAHAANADIVGRFLREAKAANLVRHRNVVEVLDIDQDADGVPFIVQEYLEGEDLGSTLDKIDGGLSLRVALGLLVPVVEAVAAAHAKGLVHRDLKPDNVFLTLGQDAGTIIPKVLDFGISKMPANAGDVRMTSNDMIMGTPAYMSPEQIQSPWLVDARSDIWALGVIIHEALTGQLPFSGESPGALFQQICTQEPLSLKAALPDVPDDIVVIVKRCMQRDPAARYASATELARDLDVVRKRVASETMGGNKAHPQAVGRTKKKSISAAEAIADTMQSARVAALSSATPAPRRTDKADPRQKWGAFESLSPPGTSGRHTAQARVPTPPPPPASSFALSGPHAMQAMGGGPSLGTPAPTPRPGAMQGFGSAMPDLGTGRVMGGALDDLGASAASLDLALPTAQQRRPTPVSTAARPRERASAPIRGGNSGLGFADIFSVIQVVALCGSVVVLRPFLQEAHRAEVQAALGSLAPVAFVVAAVVLLIIGLKASMNAIRDSSVGLAAAALGLFGMAATAAIAAAPFSTPPIDVSTLAPMSERWGPWAAALVAFGFSFVGIGRARDVLRGEADLPQGYAALLIVVSLAGIAVGIRVAGASPEQPTPETTDPTSVGFDDDY